MTTIQCFTQNDGNDLKKIAWLLLFKRSEKLRKTISTREASTNASNCCDLE